VADEPQCGPNGGRRSPSERRGRRRELAKER